MITLREKIQDLIKDEEFQYGPVYGNHTIYRFLDLDFPDEFLLKRCVTWSPCITRYKAEVTFTLDFMNREGTISISFVFGEHVSELVRSDDSIALVNIHTQENLDKAIAILTLETMN